MQSNNLFYHKSSVIHVFVLSFFDIGGRILKQIIFVFSKYPNTNTNNIRTQIFGRIRILFGPKFLDEYKYEQYLGFNLWSNTNRNICYSNNIRILFEYRIIRSPLFWMDIIRGRVRNFNSKSHAKKLNPVSRTKIRQKSKKYFFFRDTLYVI